MEIPILDCFYMVQLQEIQLEHKPKFPEIQVIILLLQLVAMN